MVQNGELMSLRKSGNVNSLISKFAAGQYETSTSCPRIGKFPFTFKTPHIRFWPRPVDSGYDYGWFSAKVQKIMIFEWEIFSDDLEEKWKWPLYEFLIFEIMR